MNTLLAANYLLTTTLRDGGATASRSNHVPTTGYVVGGLVPSLILSAVATKDEIDNEGQVGMSSHQLTQMFLDENLDKTGYVGGWLDSHSKQIYLDVVEFVDELAYAMKLADERDEIAIYDVANDKCLFVGEYFDKDL